MRFVYNPVELGIPMPYVVNTVGADGKVYGLQYLRVVKFGGKYDCVASLLSLDMGRLLDFVGFYSSAECRKGHPKDACCLGLIPGGLL